MQELHADRSFFDWLRQLSAHYGDAMAIWGQVVHAAVADGAEGLAALITATDSAIDRLVALLMAVGARHEAPNTPKGGDEVLDALDRLLGASADLLRDARSGLAREGISALGALAPRITALRAFEGEVEAATGRIQERLADTYGDPGKP